MRFRSGCVKTSEPDRRFGRGRFFFGQRGVHSRIGANFIVITVRPFQDREIADVDLGDAVLANDNLAEDAVGDGHGAKEKLALLADP